MSFNRYTLTNYLIIFCACGVPAVTSHGLYGQEPSRNPFCFGCKPVKWQCLAIGKIENTQEKLAIIAVNKIFLTVRVGDSCQDKKVIEITDNTVILRDQQNKTQKITFENV